jgi:hypothetical protein
MRSNRAFIRSSAAAYSYPVAISLVTPSARDARRGRYVPIAELKAVNAPPVPVLTDHAVVGQDRVVCGTDRVGLDATVGHHGLHSSR